MKKLLHFLFKTGYGTPVACVLTAVWMVAWSLLGCFWEPALAVLLLSLPLMVLALLLLPVAFVYSLCTRSWGHAAAQLVLGLLVVALCAIGLPILVLLGRVLPSEPWFAVSSPEGVVPFEVEFRRTPALTTEFDRRVLLPSGKNLALVQDTGGHAALAVYALADGTFALTDCVGNLSRVDAGKEVADLAACCRWYRLPDGTVKIGWRGNDGIGVTLENGDETDVEDGVPVGSSLEGRKLLGTFTPGGFAAEAEDWLAEEPWLTRAGWPEDLPFTLQRQTGNIFQGRESWRVAFPDGAAAGLGNLWDKPFDLCTLPDGNYALVSKWDAQFPDKEPRNAPTTYRIRPADGRVDLRYGDQWVELPADLHFLTSRNGLCVRGRNAAGEDVQSTNTVPVGATLEGLRPVGRLLDNGVFGLLRPPE